MSIGKMADTVGNYLVRLGSDLSQMMSSITYQRWLILSALAVVVGFVMLRGNK